MKVGPIYRIVNSEQTRRMTVARASFPNRTGD
jgi:hypothetical protein